MRNSACATATGGPPESAYFERVVPRHRRPDPHASFQCSSNAAFAEMTFTNNLSVAPCAFPAIEPLTHGRRHRLRPTFTHRERARGWLPMLLGVRDAMQPRHGTSGRARDRVRCPIVHVAGLTLRFELLECRFRIVLARFPAPAVRAPSLGATGVGPIAPSSPPSRSLSSGSGTADVRLRAQRFPCLTAGGDRPAPWRHPGPEGACGLRTDRGSPAVNGPLRDPAPADGRLGGEAVGRGQRALDRHPKLCSGVVTSAGPNCLCACPPPRGFRPESPPSVSPRERVRERAICISPDRARLRLAVALPALL